LFKLSAFFKKFCTTMEDICDNDFFDSAYMDRELADDFFINAAKNFQEDKLVYCMNEPIVIGEMKSSYFMKVNHENDVIEMGPREAKDFNYEIKHDLGNVDPVFDWYMDFMKGKRYPVPFFPPSNPIFPPSALKVKKYYAIQKYMMLRGFALGDPSYSEIQNLICFGSLYSTEVKTSFDNDIATIAKDQKLFFSYKDRFDNVPTTKTVSMQFNPFHPRSYKMIKCITQNDKVFYGYFNYNGREYPFNYNLTDNRYRIHSDKWLEMVFGCADITIECFDLVGNYDFFEDLGHDMKVMSYIDEKCSFRESIGDPETDVQPVFVEPYCTDIIPPYPYSAIGPWKNIISLGLKFDNFYVPYSTESYNTESISNKLLKKYADITEFVTYDEQHIYFQMHCVKCISKKNKK